MSTYPISQLVKVAELYYYRKKSQKEIGVLLHLSPATVSRILQEALDIGVVKVEISKEASDYGELEYSLEKKYGLDKVVVVKSLNNKDNWHIKKILGQATKEVFTKIVEPGDKVGIGPGETIYEMISSLNVEDVVFNIKLAPLMGGWCSSQLNTETSNLIFNMASTLQCEYYMLLAPAVVSNKDVKEALIKESEIKQVIKLWDQIDLAVFSIGSEIIHGSHRDYYESAESGDGVGDVVGWIIDSKGDLVDYELNERLISIPLDTLKKIPKRIAVGGDRHKCMSVKAVLEGGYATHLVTDYNTALYILNNGG